MAIIKVTDPKKVVTDPVLLSVLSEQGIDKDYVEFYQDYAPHSLGKEHSPYAKFYRDLNSNRRFMVVSGLPMVDADGVKIECGWRIAGINYFTEKNNLFRAKVQGTEVELIVRNGQPDGRKANDRLSYHAQLYLNNIEQSCGQSALLPVDPLNPNYLENTLEWDYGIAKRRLRIIEGSVLGSWVFASKPAGEVRIKYNQVGDYRLRLGQFKVGDDEELIKAADFDRLAQLGGYPVTVSDSATYYPDAHVETTSVDGHLVHVEDDAAWATLVGGAGTAAVDDATTANIINMRGDAGAANKYDILGRAIFLFDISGLPAGASISAVVSSFYGQAKADNLVGTPNVNIYFSAPASNVALVAGDFDSLGATAFCDTPITYNAFLVADPFWNNFTINAAGITAAQTASDGDGILKLGTRNVNYDVANSPPPYVAGAISYLAVYASEQGNGYKPKLVVTYTSVGAPTVTTQAVSSVGKFGATGNGNITNTGGENCTRRGFCYKEGTSGDPTTADSVAYDDGSFGTGAYTKAITGLKHNTGYRVRAYAVNSAGAGYGDTVQATTLIATGGVYGFATYA